MLPVARRALLIGFLGPAIQALGFTWTALHLLISHWSEPFGPRHLVYEPGVLLIIVGFVVTLVCFPVAQEVVQASEEDVDIPVYEPDPAEVGEVRGRPRPRAAGERLARYSTGRTHRSRGRDR